MVKHIILWKLAEELTEEKKSLVKADIKRELEALKGRVPGLEEITVYTEPMSSSNADVMLDSTLTDAGALKGYQAHPEHVRAAEQFVRPYTQVRMCMDYEL